MIRPIRQFGIVIASLVAASPANAQGPAGSCFSDPSAPVVYFSGVFTVPSLGINTS